MPNPLTDELSDDAKAELAAMFADLKLRFLPIDVDFQRAVNRSWNRAAMRRQPMIRRGW